MRKFFLTALLITFASSAQAALLDIKEVQSPGGIKAWLVEDHSIPVLSLEFGFKGAGAAHDPEDKQGLARMASNTMDEGAGNLDSKAFQKELQDKVISLHFDVDRDHFGGSLKTLSKHKERALELLHLALTEPRFDQEALDRMRQANQTRIRTSLSDPEWMAARLLNDKAYEGHSYALNTGGTLSSLERIKAKDLRAFQRTMLGKNNLVIGVAGDITPEELSSILDQVFGDLPAVKLPEIQPLTLQNEGKTFLYEQEIPQTLIEMMLPGIDHRDPEYHSAEVMNFVLGSSGFGSRLTEEIREKRGLTYGIYSMLNNLVHVDTLGVSTSTANENTPQMLELIRSEFLRMNKEPVTDKELADAKSYLIGSLPLSLTSTDKIAALLRSLQTDELPMDYLDKRESIIQTMTKEKVNSAARKLLTPDRFLTILVGNPPDQDPEKSALQKIKSLPNVQ